MERVAAVGAVHISGGAVPGPGRGGHRGQRRTGDRQRRSRRAGGQERQDARGAADPHRGGDGDPRGGAGGQRPRVDLRGRQPPAGPGARRDHRDRCRCARPQRQGRVLPAAPLVGGDHRAPGTVRGGRGKHLRDRALPARLIQPHRGPDLIQGARRPGGVQPEHGEEAAAGGPLHGGQARPQRRRPAGRRLGGGRRGERRRHRGDAHAGDLPLQGGERIERGQRERPAQARGKDAVRRTDGGGAGRSGQPHPERPGDGAAGLLVRGRSGDYGRFPGREDDLPHRHRGEVAEGGVAHRQRHGPPVAVAGGDRRPAAQRAGRRAGVAEHDVPRLLVHPPLWIAGDLRRHADPQVRRGAWRGTPRPGHGPHRGAGRCGTGDQQGGGAQARRPGPLTSADPSHRRHRCPFHPADPAGRP